MHLFDSDAREEEALCGADASVHDVATVQHYLERRRHDLSLPMVCNRCKEPSIQFAWMRISTGEPLQRSQVRLHRARFCIELPGMLSPCRVWTISL